MHLSGPYHLPQFIDRWTAGLFQGAGVPAFDFSKPAGEPALAPASSVSWIVFKNPVSLFVGGVAAVIMEFALPGVRSGVWDHSSFKTKPVERLQRTGLAAMVTVYGAQAKARDMIDHVTRLHNKISGVTEAGETYSASDVDLLNWVQATAIYGFTESYSRYVKHLDENCIDRCFDEGLPAARLYSATGAPSSRAEFHWLLARLEPRMTASPILFEFLDIIKDAPVLSPAFKPVQRLLVGAAVDIVPDRIRNILGLDPSLGLKPWQDNIIRQAGGLADRIVLAEAPPAQSCLRLGLPVDYLYRG
ncbi:oxygenase MpaB family protein [Hoeflea sp. WL0058]|uniref:Oxygenase MpaB family protein n=1 Tax=Flavimaribacter sediminis TaxID=2865987 RepID=A0AAE3CZF6_9HYPH|nr:oxygenase MpaB family protein [Flavimaribacter sediminis]MBW8637235.1 oxygenase MpaB family protein [Flavimaribacter sediminis]